jgi:hypothetical protein
LCDLSKCAVRNLAPVLFVFAPSRSFPAAKYSWPRRRVPVTAGQDSVPFQAARFSLAEYFHRLCSGSSVLASCSDFAFSSCHDFSLSVPAARRALVDFPVLPSIAFHFARSTRPAWFTCHHRPLNSTGSLPSSLPVR